MQDGSDTTAPILVTGATGYLGRTLVDKLAKEGHHVRVYLRDLSKAGDWEKLGVEIFRGDYSDLTRLEEAAMGTRLIYHLGEAPTVSNKARRYNVELVRRLIGRALHFPRQRLIFTSSLSVAGIPSATPATEETAPNISAEATIGSNTRSFMAYVPSPICLAC